MGSEVYYLRHYWKSICIVAAIWVLSLMPIPETPLDDVAFMDKWTHFVMYGSLSLIVWWDYLHCHRFVDYRKLIAFGVVLPILMGGLLEIIQSFTTYRSGDWLDFAANSVGVILGAAVGLLIKIYGHRR